MENCKSLPTLRMLLADKPSRSNRLSSLIDDEQCEKVQRAEIKYCTDDCKGCRDRGTHLDYGGKDRASASKNSLTTINMAKSGPGHERKTRGVTFNSKVFFDSGEVEDLHNDLGENAVRMYTSKELKDSHDTSTSEHIFRTDRKEVREYLSEIEELPETATLGEDVKLRQETSAVIHEIEQVQVKQHHQESRIESPSGNPKLEASPALEIAQDVQPQGWPCQLTTIQNMYLYDLSRKLD